MKKNYLVTGGNGFIGRSIVDMLLKEGNRVTIYDNISRHKFKKFKDVKNLTFIKGDICNYKNLEKSMKGIDAVIHLAYINGTSSFYKIPDKIIEVAVKGLVNVFDACLKKKVKEIYLASSSEVYHFPSKIPTDENTSLLIPDPTNPRFSYGAGKILTEIYGLSFAKYFKKLVIFRPHNVYGPDMGNDHVIPEIVNKLLNLKKGKLKIQGSGKETRSFIYIEDFVQSIKLIIKNGKHKNIYNIGNNDEISILNLVRKITKMLDKKNLISPGNLQVGGTVRRCPNINKIKKIGYKKQFNLNQGLKNTIYWYKNNYEKK